MQQQDVLIPYINYHSSRCLRHYKKVRNEQRDKRKIRSNSNSEQSYEIESIVNHKYQNESYIFLIKWKGYDNIQNTRVSIDDFNEKDTLTKYMKDDKLD